MTKGEALTLISCELDRAIAKHKVGFITPRHGHSVIEEEYDEFWDAIKADDLTGAFKEAIQLGAMAARYLMDQQPSTEERGMTTLAQSLLNGAHGKEASQTHPPGVSFLKGDKVYHKTRKINGVVHSQPRAHSNATQVLLEGHQSPQYFRNYELAHGHSYTQT